MDKNRYRKSNRSEYIGSKLTIITFSLISIESIIIRNRWLLFYCYRYRFWFHDIVDFIAFVDQKTSSLKKVVKIGLVWMTCRQQAYVFICFSIHCGFTPHWIVLNQLFFATFRQPDWGVRTLNLQSRDPYFKPLPLHRLPFTSWPCWGHIRVKLWQATQPWNSNIRLDKMVTNNIKMG